MPRVRLLLPASLRRYWSAPEAIDLAGATLAEAMADLARQDPGIADRILDERGRPRPHVHLFVNGESLGSRDLAAVALREGDVVRALPAVSGG
ncbi:MAG TPA: MoaD/ThiS family protein [Candidatus Thermoplasmatota archaeon]|nr:MoaD/ThiS family protein [Candidatus Thermoplasmatota archaeon]